jgi:hypothetical protein
MNGNFFKMCVTLTLTGIVAASTLTGCESGPGRLKVRNNNPIFGDTEAEYERTGPELLVLPMGWVANEERLVDIDVDGRRFKIRLCIARSMTNPGCIYVNAAGCNANQGWQLYCQVANDSGGSTGNRPKLPVERGSASYDPITGEGQAEFVSGGRQPLPEGLVNTEITFRGETLSADQFAQRYGPWIPKGATVSMSGSTEELAWNSVQLDKELTFTDLASGKEIHAGFIHTEEGLPVYYVAIDGEIVHQGIAVQP